MKPHTLRFSTLLLLTFFVSAPLHAHLLKIFAVVEGNQIKGSVYFSGGDPVPGASVSLTSATGDPLAQLIADQQGKFSYQVDTPSHIAITADTKEGHMAKWVIKAAEIAPPTDTVKQVEPNSATYSNSDLERAIARQLTPLKRQLVNLEERLRYQDIVGALGYILGLAGLAAWYLGRKKGASNQNNQ